MKRVFFSMVLALAMFAPLAVNVAEARVTVNGRPVVFPDQQPVVVSDETLVPVRGVFEALGFDVTWDESARRAELRRPGYEVFITIGSDIFTINGIPVSLGVPAQIIGERAMLSIRAVLESMGYFVDWDAGERTLIVYSAPHQATPAAFQGGVQTIAGTGSHGSRDGQFAQFNLPSGVFGVSEGNLIVADTYNNLIRTIASEGSVARTAGNVLGHDEFSFPRGAHRDGEALDARFNRPMDGAVDSQGRIFIADSVNNAIRVIADGNVFTFAGGGEPGHADGGPGAALFNRPSAVAFGPCGGLFVADTLNNVIRRIDANGSTSTVAGIPGSHGHRDGEAALALFNSPMGIAVSEDGVIFISDTGNHLIRVIENGYVRTLAGTLVFPGDVNWDEPGDFDNEPLGGFADGNEAMFSLPMGLALWENLLIVADSANHRIRAVLPEGETVTLAGNGSPEHVDGPPGRAAFHFPRGVFVRGDSLYIADTGNNVIRQILLERGGA